MVAYPCIGTNKEESAIGMDVISTANWHFNFKNNIVNIIPTSETETIPTKNIAFSYTKTKDPLTNLYIGNFCFHDVLLDMGMKSWDICLSDTDILQLLNTYNPKDSAEVTSNGLNGSVQTMEYYFDSLNIEKEIYKNICIKKGKKNIIGIDFFRRFNHLFWDSKHKKVYLWNNEK